MNRLSAILPASQVLVDVDASSKKRVFEHAGLLKAVGFKYGRWTDSILMQRALGPGAASPPDDEHGPLKPKSNGKHR